MRRALRAIAAGHVTHRAILLAAPANAFRVGRQKGKFTHHVCSQIESIMQPCCQSCFALRQMAAVAAHRRLVTSFEGRFTDLQKCPSCGLLFLSGCFSNGPCSALLAAAGRVSPRRATDFLAARQESQQRNVPYIQRPRKLRGANLSGQPALTTNTGVRQNSLRAKALRSNSCRKSEHEVWLSCGSQTAAVCCDRWRWLKG